MNKSLLIFSLIIILFTGCASKKSVLFVTKTSLGVDFDGKPAALNVAYDRTEGYIGPRYDNGAVPPVMARIQTDGAIFKAKVRQVYATGNAARTLASDQLYKGPDDLQGGKEIMFFGTSTTTGLKVGFTGYVPDSFLFGFRRKELSYIPVGTVENKDYYPSVLATFDTLAQADSSKSAGLQGGQFFATGAAAEYYANRKEVREYFEGQLKDAFQAYHDAVREQESEAVRILRCYAGIKEDDLPTVWYDANKHGLFKEKDSLAQMIDWYDKAFKDSTVKEENLRKANKRYASEIAITEGANPLRIGGLQNHREKVCELSRK